MGRFWKGTQPFHDSGIIGVFKHPLSTCSNGVDIATKWCWKEPLICRVHVLLREFFLQVILWADTTDNSFTTLDADHDNNTSNCAQSYKGAMVVHILSLDQPQWIVLEPGGVNEWKRERNYLEELETRPLSAESIWDEASSIINIELHWIRRWRQPWTPL